MTLGAALAIVGTSLGGVALYVTVIFASAARTSAIGVVRQLRKTPNEYTVLVRRSRRAWNPAGEARSRGLTGPGTATYRLERGTDGDVVHLTFTPPGEVAQQFSGSIPDRVSEVHGRKVRTWSPYVLLAMSLSQIALGVLGVIVGLVVTSGHSNTARVAGVFVGGFGAFIVIPMIVLLAYGVASAIWQTAHADRR